MSRRLARLILLLVTLPVLSPVASSVSGGELDELLRRVQQHGTEARAADRQREARFVTERDRQAGRVAAARAELAALQQRAGELERQRADNAEAITGLQTRLDHDAAELQQVFDVARRSAAMLDGVLRESLVSAQYPGRGQALIPLLDDQAAPTVADLRALWATLLQEMVAGGRSARFESELIGADGYRRSAAVTRIGSFTAVADGQFLSWRDGALYQLPQQPDAGLRAVAAGFEQTATGLAPAVVDPSRGAWLEVLVHRPSLLDRVRQGGVIGYVIIALGGLGLLLGLWRLLVVSVTDWQVRRELLRQSRRSGQPSRRNPLGRVLLAWQQLRVGDAFLEPGHVELQLEEAALREVPPLTRTQSFLKLLAAVTPLLGLLGTVTGMILTFQAITLSGNANTQLMADGIGQALVTTVLGLVAAIPLLFLHNLVQTRSRAVIQVLDQETAGLIADSLTAPAAAGGPGTAEAAR